MKRRLIPVAVLVTLLTGCIVPVNTGGSAPPSSEIPQASSSAPEPADETEATVDSTPSVSVSVGEDSELPKGALGDSGNSIDQISLESVTAYAQAVITNADQVWSTWMIGRGYPEPYVTYNIIQPGNPLTVEEKCAVPIDQAGNTTRTIDSKFPNAFFCAGQSNGVDRGILILPVESLAKMWSGDILGNDVSNSGRVGDFAAGSVIAHEFGHHIQDELTEDTEIKAPPGKNSELLADCFAGVWTTALYSQGNLEEGDLDEALNALSVMGDKTTNPKFPHGTAEERNEAFRYGIYGSQADPRGGVPATCIKQYWPNFTGPV
jgi:hypothetical protein